MINLIEIKKLWNDLGDIPVNDREEIDETFLHFQIGTSIYDIWHWFEDTYSISVHDYLMFPED
jgi:hypothetical protein